MIILEYPRGDGFSSLLEIDAAIVENYNAFSQVTENPIEDGATVSDHTIVDALTISFDCVISNTPLRAFSDPSSVINTGVAKVFFPEDRVARAYGILRFLRDQSIPVRIIRDEPGFRTTISTREGFLPDFENMVIEVFTVRREAVNGQSMFFQLGFKQIQTATSQSVDVDLKRPPDPVEPRGESEGNKGKQQPKIKSGSQETAVKDEIESRSFLKSVDRAIR